MSSVASKLFDKRQTFRVNIRRSDHKKMLSMRRQQHEQARNHAQSQQQGRQLVMQLTALLNNQQRDAAPYSDLLQKLKSLIQSTPHQQTFLTLQSASELTQQIMHICSLFPQHTKLCLQIFMNLTSNFALSAQLLPNPLSYLTLQDMHCMWIAMCLLGNILNEEGGGENREKTRSLGYLMRAGVVTRLRCLMEAVKEEVRELKEPMMWLAKAILEAVAEGKKWFEEGVEKLAEVYAKQVRRMLENDEQERWLYAQTLVKIWVGYYSEIPKQFKQIVQQSICSPICIRFFTRLTFLTTYSLSSPKLTTLISYLYPPNLPKDFLQDILLTLQNNIFNMPSSSQFIFKELFRRRQEVTLEGFSVGLNEVDYVGNTMYLKAKGMPDSAMAMLLTMYVQVKGMAEGVRQIVTAGILGQELLDRLRDIGKEIEEVGDEEDQMEKE